MKNNKIFIACLIISTMIFASHGDSRTVYLDKSEGSDYSSAINNVQSNLCLDGYNLPGSLDSIKVRCYQQINYCPDDCEKNSGWIRKTSSIYSTRYYSSGNFKAGNSGEPYYIKIDEYGHSAIGKGVLYD